MPNTSKDKFILNLKLLITKSQNEIEENCKLVDEKLKTSNKTMKINQLRNV